MLEKKGLVKLAEECGELSVECTELVLLRQLGKLTQISAKKMTCMETDSHWDGAGSLKERMESEIGDVIAACKIVIDNFGLDADKIDGRIVKKYALFQEWTNEK